MNLGLLLIPALGGYYLLALRESDLGLTEFRVLIPLAEVASARRFDPDVYEILRHSNTQL